MLNSLLRRLTADRYREYLAWMEPIAEAKDLLGINTPADIRQERRKRRNLSTAYVDLFQVRKLVQPGWESLEIKFPRFRDRRPVSSRTCCGTSVGRSGPYDPSKSAVERPARTSSIFCRISGRSDEASPTFLFLGTLRAYTGLAGRVRRQRLPRRSELRDPGQPCPAAVANWAGWARAAVHRAAVPPRC